MFEFNGPAQLLHLNVRKEGPEDGRTLAVDAKFSIDYLPAERLAFLVGADTFGAALWDIDGSVVFPGIDEIHLSAELSNHSGRIDRTPVHFDTLKRFRFTPCGQRGVNLTFVASIAMPAPELMLRLADSVREIIRLEIIPQPQLDLAHERA